MNLHAAVSRNENAAVIRGLLDTGADVEARDSDGLTALHAAAELSDNTAVISALLDAGASVEARNNNGFTPLDAAALFNENAAVMRVLLDAAADANMGIDDALYWAASANSNPAVIRVLVDAGADVPRGGYSPRVRASVPRGPFQRESRRHRTLPADMTTAEYWLRRLRACPHALRHAAAQHLLDHGLSARRALSGPRSIARRKEDHASHDPSHKRLPLAPVRNRSERDPRLARACQPRYPKEVKKRVSGADSEAGQLGRPCKVSPSLAPAYAVCPWTVVVSIHQQGKVQQCQSS